MMQTSNGVAVLGLGNLLHSDDGLGVHGIQRLRKDVRMDSSVTLLDGGTQGLDLIPYISGFPRLLVLDAVDVGDAGTLRGNGARRASRQGNRSSARICGLDGRYEATGRAA